MRKIIILASVVIILVLASGFILKGIKKQSIGNLKPTPTVSATRLKTFKSSGTMKFTVQIPNTYEPDEKLTYVDFKKGGDLVDVIRNGTNFGSLDEYLKNSDSRKNLKISSERILEINGYEAKDRVEFNKDNGVSQKVYYIYINNWVYIISTKSETLYSDLDQIAQSFRYTP